MLRKYVFLSLWANLVMLCSGCYDTGNGLVQNGDVTSSQETITNSDKKADQNRPHMAKELADCLGKEVILIGESVREKGIPRLDPSGFRMSVLIKNKNLPECFWNKTVEVSGILSMSEPYIIDTPFRGPDGTNLQLAPGPGNYPGDYYIEVISWHEAISLR